jgi:hypothetical protein
MKNTITNLDTKIEENTELEKHSLKIKEEEIADKMRRL